MDTDITGFYVKVLVIKDVVSVHLSAFGMGQESKQVDLGTPKQPFGVLFGEARTRFYFLGKDTEFRNTTQRIRIDLRPIQSVFYVHDDDVQPTPCGHWG